MLNRKINKSQNEQMSVSMELIIAILFRYSEVNKVIVNQQSQELILDFLIDSNLNEIEREEFRLRLEQSMRLFKKLDNSAPNSFKIDYRDYGDLVKLKITTQAWTLKEEELDFLIKLVTDEFNSDLLIDQLDKNNANYLAEYKNTIETILLDWQEEKLDQLTIGFRERNKVVVFNKSI